MNRKTSAWANVLRRLRGESAQNRCLEESLTPITGRYIVASVSIIVLGVLGALFAQWTSQMSTAASTTPVANTSPFAILYVLAQSIERINEFLHPIIDIAMNRKEGHRPAMQRKEEGLRALSTQSTPSSEATQSTDPGNAVQKARNDVLLLTQSLSLALALIAASYFRFSLLGTVGVTGVTPWIDVLVTSIAIMGGTKGLHDLLSNVQKTKEKAEAQAVL